MTSRNAAQFRKMLCDASFLGTLPASALEHLLAQSHALVVEGGETLFSRGDDGDSLMLVLSGRLKVANLTADGREVVYDFLTEGDVIGEIAALDGRGRTATVTAMEQSTLLIVHRRNLLPLLVAHPIALLEIVEVLCDRLRGANEVAEDSLYDMRRRVARGLLRLAERHGRRSSGGVIIDLALNQRDLGNFLRLSRENTNRQLSALRAQQIIDVREAIIVIVDEAALRQIAGES